MRRLTRWCAGVGAALLTTAVLTPAASAQTSTHYSGTLADGASWIADVPASWNGTVLLFSHGFGPTTAQDAPSSGTATELLDAGYALAGSGYTGSWWALGSAVSDQFGTLAAVEGITGRPTHVIAVGVSMGGLVNTLINENGAGRVDGALTLCGLVAGGVDLNNYQYDAEYALTTLLGGQAIPLLNYTDPVSAGAAGLALSTLVSTAQNTAEGRARIALAAAFLNTPTWAPNETQPAPTDYAGQEAQQETWMTGGSLPQLTFEMFGRYWIENAAGGDSTWNLGVDYAAELASSPHFAEVRALYQAAGLNLGADLATLDGGAHVTPNLSALAWMERTSTTDGLLTVPQLDVHTISDQLVPVEQEAVLARETAAAGRSALLRQAYVDRQSHCNFTDAEIIAALHAVEHRVDTGSWGDLTTPASLESAALALNLGDAAYIPYTPAMLVGARNPW